MSNEHFPFGAPENRRPHLPAMCNKPILMVSAAAVFTVFAAVMFTLLDRPGSAARSERNGVVPEAAATKAADATTRPEIQAPPSQLLAQAPAQLAQRLDPPAQAFVPAPAFVPSPAPAPVPSASTAAPIRSSAPPLAPATAGNRGAELAFAPSAPSRAADAADATGETRREPKVAAIDPEEVKPRPSIASKRGAPTECLPGTLRTVLADLEARFGPVTIVSTTHLHTDNHSPGSARAKMHQACRAVDITTSKEPRAVIAYLRSRAEVGGVNTYRNRVIHFDVNANYTSTASNATRAGRGRVSFSRRARAARR